MPLRPLQSRFLAILVLLVAGLAPAGAAAADAAATSALTSLYQLARLMDAAVIDFNMLLGEEQSPAYKVRLDATIKDLELARKTAATALGEAAIPAASISALGNQADAFLRLLRDNRRTTLATGAPEGAVVDEMMLQRRETRKAIDAIYVGLEKRAGLSGSALSEARSLALLLQQMAALYIETAASAGGVAYRSQEEEASIDMLARNFSDRLAKLAARAKGKESTQLLHGIESKWRFIEKSMLNYRERTVPFLVDRYTQAIVTDLVTLAEALERGA